MKLRDWLSIIKHTIKYPKYGSIYLKYKDYTMFFIDAYINNLKLAETVKNVEGAIVECGNWKGGMISGFSEILDNKRTLYLFDSFEGLPDATEIDGDTAKNYQIVTKQDPTIGYNNCTASEEDVREALKKTGNKNFNINKGWFKDTLPLFDKNTKIALLHLDGDWYDSTMEGLENLFDSVVPGGLIILDDYTNWEGCTKAVHDYLSKNKSPLPVRNFNNQIAYIKKA